jgi:hypothetical protein
MTRLAFLVFAALLLSACGSTLLNQRIERKAKQWALIVEHVNDGPDDYARGDNVHFVPPSGMRFLWFKVRLRNDASARRSFNYDRCDLDDGEDRILPALVDKDMFINVTVDDADELDPGEEITRKIAFAYPEDHLPTRLMCGEIAIELPFESAG